MIISFLGLAGSGKSTQADLVAQKTGYDHISVGQLLRETHEQHLMEYMKIGKLINPTVVNGLLQEKLDQLQARTDHKGVILDGYPRQMAQADWLIEHKDDYDLKIVVVIDVSPEEAVKRLLARKRLDDNAEAIKSRVAIYKQETEKVIDHLKEQGVFILRVNGEGSIDETHKQVWESIKNVVAIA